MKNLKRIDEAVGSILERRAAADRLLKDVVKGNASEVEGIKLSKEMAQGFLDWLKYSTYGKKFGALPFNMLFTAAFNWGLDRFVKGANTKLKAEFKELKAQAKEMSKQQKMKAESLDEAKEIEKNIKDIEDGDVIVIGKNKHFKVDYIDPWRAGGRILVGKDVKTGKKGKMKIKFLTPRGNSGLADDTMLMVLKESTNEAIDLLKSTWRGTKGWNDVARIMDAGLMKAIKAGSVPLSYAKDYVKSLERMAKRNAKKFFDEYGNFSEDDFIEDVEYNMANENVNEGLLGQIRKEIGKTQTALKKKWKKTGGYENFGQDEISKLQDRHGYSSMVYGTPEQRKAAKLIDALDQWAMNYVGESVDEGFRRSTEPFTFTAKEVQDAADLIAKAIARMDKVKAEVHDMDYAEGEGAGFEISMDGEKYEGGSYDVRPTGEVVNVAIGNSFPNAIYAKIGDKNINQIMKNIKKFESLEVNEAAPRMKKSKEERDIEKSMMIVSGLKKGGAGNRYGKEFDKAKNKALAAINDMLTYAKIGI
jgi:hypothetical protein